MQMEWYECNTEESFVTYQCSTMQKDCKIYVLHFEQVWSTAEFILGNYEIQRLICGNFCAPDLDIVLQFFPKLKT